MEQVDPLKVGQRACHAQKRHLSAEVNNADQQELLDILACPK
jgi:hypothetical protein